MVETGKGVFLIVFGINCQNNANGFQRFAITLELGIYLTLGHFGADGNAIDAIVPHNAAPECIVKVKRQDLLIPAIDGFDNIGQAVRKRWDCIQTHCILVHMPIECVTPGCQAIIGRKIINVIDKEILMRRRVGIELLVKPRKKVGAAVRVPDIPVAKQPIIRAVKVVLDDRAVKLISQGLPHGGKTIVLCLQHLVNLSRG